MPVSAKGLFLTMCSELNPDSLGDHGMMPGIISRLNTNNASTLLRYIQAYTEIYLAYLWPLMLFYLDGYVKKKQ